MARRRHRPKRPGGPPETWPARPPARPAAGLFLLILLPAGAGFSGIRVFELWPDAGADAAALVVGGSLIGAVTGLVMARSSRTNPRALLGFGGLTAVGVLATYGIAVSRKDPLPSRIPVPYYIALPLAALVTTLLAVGIVFTVLWLAGYVTFKTKHRAWLWLRESADGHGAGEYQVICDCSWSSETVSAEDLDAEERAYEIARGHCRKVMPNIQLSL